MPEIIEFDDLQEQTLGKLYSDFTEQEIYSFCCHANHFQRLTVKMQEEMKNQMDYLIHPPMMLVEVPHPGSKLEERVRDLKEIEESYLAIPRWIRNLFKKKEEE